MVEENGSTKTTEYTASKGLKNAEENGQENLSENAKNDGKNENVVEKIGQEPGWRRFKQWVHCFCVVTFDLELGQTIEVVYPGNAQLSQSERTDLCYLAFPDSNCSPIATSFSGSTSSPTLSNGQSRPIQRVKEASSSTDSAHHFRVRRTLPEQMDKFTESIAQQFPPYLRPDGRFFYGFAHFRRQRDPSIARGYSQKSIVLLTHLPFVALFSRVLTEVALAYFTGGESAIETACRQIGQFWPAPIPGGDRLLSLPIFGLRFCCSIPVDSNAASSSLGEVDFLDDDFEAMKGSSPAAFPKKQSIETEEEGEFEIIDYLHCNILHLHSIHEPDQHFHAGIKRVLPHLHLLWELVLLGEPLLILAPNPSLGSSLVHSLISLISPLRYNGDHRPYFTIHDSDFNEMSSRQNRPMNSCILGVTNPFFLKAFAHWPHILKLNIIQPQMRRERSESRLVRQLKAQPAAQFVLGNLKRSGTASKGLDLEGEEENNGGDEQQQKMIKRLSDLSLLENRSSGFLCAHRQFLAQDKTLPRQLLRTPSDSPSQWAALRWFFAELTQNFMSPLESFISTLLPLRRELSPFQSVPQMRPFSLEQFLLSLRHFGHPGVKGDWQGLYRQFVARSPNFIGWLRQRQKDIERQLRLEHMDLIANFNFTPEILAERNQIEIVDLVMKLTNRLGELNERQKLAKGSKNHIQMDGTNSPIKKNFLENQRLKLQNRLSQILDSVDDELKMVLLSNPAFRKAAEEAEQK